MEHKVLMEVIMDYCIRRAVEGDYEGICALCEVVDNLHRDHMPHIFRKPDGPAREWPYIKGLLEAQDTGIFVAELSENLVGFVVVLLEQAADIPILAPRSYAVVDNLVVDDGMRRRGVGRALMERAESWACKQGATQVELGVYEFNQGAQAMYEALGYEVARRRMVKGLGDQGCA